jgi:hypothetical protein
MPVQIQFHIIKFSPDVTTVLSLLTHALDKVHGNLFRFYERFPKSKCLYFFHYIYLQQIQTMKITECTEWGLYSG